MIYDKASLVHIPSGVKSGTLYNVVPNNTDGDFDFTRGSTATRVNKDGLIETVASGVPRLNYPLLDGVVQDCPALLLEPSRTNLVLQSENFNTTWFNSGTGSGTTTTITSNSAIAPDGTQTADLIAMTRPTNAAGTYIAQQQSTGAGVHIGSIYLKAKNAANVGKQFQLWQWHSGERNMITVTLTDYWKRFNTVSDYSLPSGTNELVAFGFRGGVGTDTDVEFYAWGAQGELGTYPTSYIPTSGQEVTRSADVCNGAEADFNDSEGVLYANISALANDGTIRRLSLSNGTTNQLHRIEYSSTDNTIFGVTFVTPSNQSAISTTLNDSTLFSKIAYKYKANDFQLWVNGFMVGTDLNGSVPTGLSEFAFDNGGGGNDFYGKTKELMTFKEALSDIELETLTSYKSFNEMATEQLYTIQ